MSKVAWLMSEASASITDFKANPNAVIKESRGETVVVLKSNQPFFYAVPPALYEKMMDALEDLEMIRVAEQRMNDGQEPIVIDINDL